MTSEAAKLPGVSAVRATGERLPFDNDTVRLVYYHLSIHYGDWRVTLDEAHRVLGRGGDCWIWTMGEQHHRSSFLTKWFPSVGDIDTARFPEPAEVADYLGRNWTTVTMGSEIEPKAMQAGQWRAAAEARFVSTLQLVPEDEFWSGLAAFDAAHPDPAERVEYILAFDWIRASK
jgi:ubiquinone/menaquinone biosynthesis C-methylase UbiE